MNEYAEAIATDDLDFSIHSFPAEIDSPPHLSTEHSYGNTTQDE
jgi:hypothetical protein